MEFDNEDDAQKLGSMITSLSRTSSGEILVSGFSNVIICINKNIRTTWKVNEIEEYCTITVIFVSELLKGVFLACSDSIVYFFDISSKVIISKFEGHTSEVLSLAVDQGNKVLFTGSSDTSIKIWSIAESSIIFSYTSELSSIISLSFCPTQLLCAAGLSSDTVYIIRYENSEYKLEEFSVSDSDEVSCVLVLETMQKTFAVGFLTGKIEIWSVDQYRLNELKGHKDRVNALESIINFEGIEFIISGSRDFTVIIWRVNDGSIMNTLHDHNHLVNCINADSGGEEFVSADWNGNIKIFELNL